MPFLQSEAEGLLFYTAVVAMVVTVALAWAAFLREKDYHKSITVTLALSVLIFAASIALRWVQYGYGPFVTLYEVLISNLFSLGLLFILFYSFIPLVRSSALVVLPLLVIIGLWAADTDMSPLEIPATYDTILLWVHVGVGKVFLGLCLTAFGLSGVLLMQRITTANVFNRLAATASRDELAWRFMAVAFVFHSLMLIAGAAWAQDAWGRFWAWDSLETWAFITWLALGLSLHARVTWQLPDWAGWLMILSVFTLALLTFFGVPFSSIGPHKGII